MIIKMVIIGGLINFLVSATLPTVVNYDRRVIYEIGFSVRSS